MTKRQKQSMEEAAAKVFNLWKYDVYTTRDQLIRQAIKKRHPLGPKVRAGEECPS